MATKEVEIPARLVDEFHAKYVRFSGMTLVLDMKGKEALPMGELLVLKDELQRLSLDTCENLRGFPAEFSQLRCLREFEVNNAKLLERFPEEILALEQLKVWR